MSNINIQPLNDRVIVLPDPKREKTDGGLFIPENAKENYADLQWGEVMKVSKNVPEIKEGDRIQFLATAGREMEIGGVKYRSITDRDIWHMEVPAAEDNKL